MEKNEKARCPICGKFANKAKVDKYNALVNENKEMRNKLIAKEILINSLKEGNAHLSYAEKSAQDELKRLRNRGFWARLLNR